MDEIFVHDIGDVKGPPKATEKSSSDPFDSDVRVLKNVSPAIRKKAGRVKSKAVDEDSVLTGYSAFQVKMPPYNLDYLAKLYEINPYNYGAINAKVISVVGQGYDFVESDKLQLELLSDGLQLLALLVDLVWCHLVSVYGFRMQSTTATSCKMCGS